MVCMKSAKTMLAQAKRCAIGNGIRIMQNADGKKLIGYAFSLGEITKIYQMDGFTTKTMRRHIDMWADLGLVIPAGKIWFVQLQPTDVVALSDLMIEKMEHEQRGDDGCIYVAEAVA